MCNEELIADDEMGDLRDDERVDIFNEIRALEVEFAHWCRLYAIRAQEKHDTKRNLHRLSVARRELRVAYSPRLPHDGACAFEVRADGVFGCA